jgi:CheY-like chemotaxis protein
MQTATIPARILIVEDEKGSRITLTALLEGEGYHVIACETAQEALGVLTAGEPVETWWCRT